MFVCHRDRRSRVDHKREEKSLGRPTGFAFMQLNFWNHLSGRIQATTITESFGMPQTLDTLMRQWRMLRLVPRHPRKICSRELTDKLAAEGYAVTKRTVERDLLSLSVHFPLVSDMRCTPYGWSWQKNAKALDLPALSSTEALSFLMVKQFLQPLVPASLLDQLAPYFNMAEQSLETQSASPKGRRDKDWLKKVAVVQPNQPLLPAKILDDVQSGLQDALLKNLQVKLGYKKRGETAGVEYIAHPLGLIQRGSVIYLVCTLFGYQDIKLLALHRMLIVDILDEPSKTPKGFSLASYIAEGHLGFGSAKPISLHLRFRNGAGDHLWDTPLSAEQAITESADGLIDVRATVPDTSQLIWWLLAMGENVEVLAPDALRKKIVKSMEATLTSYQDKHKPG